MAQLRIVEVGDLKTASDGRNYFVATFRGGFGTKGGSRTFWQQFKKDTKTGLPTKEKYWERGSREEAIAAMESREILEGEKVTRTVETYSIPGSDRKLSTYSSIVFSDENILTVFANAKHKIVDEETGEVIEPAAPKAVLGTVSKEAVLEEAEK